MADFITINIGSILKGQNTTNTSDSKTPMTEPTAETQFWDDFFKTNWPDEDIAEILNKNMGDQLKKDIKMLGFNKKSNPIIAFLQLSYVQKELIRTKLLNNTTYMVLRNTIANHYV